MIFACPFCQTKVGKTENTCHACNRTMTRHCSYCSESVSVLATLCKYCGEALEPALDTSTKLIPRVVAPAPASTPAPAPDIEFVGEMKHVAWEDPTRRGMFSRWWSTWSASQFSPAAFWSRLPAEGGTRKPISYAWFLSAQFLVLALPIFAILGACIGVAHDAPAWAYGVGALAYAAIFPVTWVVVAAGYYVAAAMWHLPLKVLGAKGGYQATLRALAYNSGAAAWGIVPFLGGFIQLVMMPVGYYHGFQSLHGMSKGRALVAALLPFIAVGCLVVLLVAASLALGCGPDGDGCIGPAHCTPENW